MKTNILTNIRVWAIMMVCLTVLGVGNAWGDVTLYQETFGDNGSSNTVIADATTYSASTTYFTAGHQTSAVSNYSGDSKVGKNNVAASDNDGASGNSAVWFTGPSSPAQTKTLFQVDNINISGYTSLSLKFNLYRTNGTNSNNYVTVKYTIDSGSEQTLSFTAPSNAAEWTWCTGSLSGTGSSLTIKFLHYTNGGYTMRLDDIILTGISAGYAVTYNNGGHGTAPSNTTASSVTLSDISATATGWTCTGWKANVAVTNTSTSASISAGTLIPNGTGVTLSQATTFTAQWETTKYTVSFGVSPAGYGTVSQASVANVPHGTVPTSSTNTITVNGTTVTATPHAQDADYNYAFSSWSNVPGSVTGAVTITANFTRTARPLTNYRTVCCTELGEVSGSASRTTPTTATLTWSNVTGAEKYQVKVVGSSSHNDWTDATSGVSVTGLSCGTAYTAYFRAIDTNNSHCSTGPESTASIPASSWTVTSSGVTNATADPAIPATTCNGFSTTITAATGYTLPSTVTVSGASHTWNQATGALTISTVTGDVTITITPTCVEPVIGTDPADASYQQGASPLALTVAATLASGTLTYQWQKSTDGGDNWSNESGTGYNTATYAAANISTAVVGTTKYRCIVGNSEGGCTVTSGVATITITAAANFVNGATVFIQAESNSAWDASACVKAWFSNNGAGGAAQTTYWLFDATGGDAGKKLYATVVPAEGNVNQVTLQRFDPNSDCDDFWNSNGTLTKASDGGSNTLRSYGSQDNNVAWNVGSLTMNLMSSDAWNTPVATVTDQGAGVWTGTYEYTPSNTSTEYIVATNYNGNIGNTGNNSNATLSGMIVGSTYNVTATLNVIAHSLVMSKTFVKGTVHFDLQGHGLAIADLTDVTNGSKISAPSAPSATGYTFGGWFTDPECTDEWTFATDEVSETMTLYAKWTANVYTITKTFSNVTNASLPASFTYTGSTTTALNSTFAVDATNFFLPSSIAVTMGGTPLTAGTDYTYNNSTGAFTFDVAVTGNIVITASATAKLKSIAITTQPTTLAYLEGESFSSTGAVVRATMGDATTKDVTASVTWTPAGALSAGTDQTVTATYTENGVEKTATTTIDVYSVTVNKVAASDGSSIDAAGVTATCTTRALAAGVSTTNYTFKNWEFDGSNNDLAITSTTSASTTLTGTPTGNVTIKAVFYKPITVTWKVGNGAATGGTSEVKYNTKVSSLPSTPADNALASCGDANKFMGWTALGKIETPVQSAPADLFTSKDDAGCVALTTNTTYRAVFAHVTAGSSGNEELTSSELTTNITNTTCAYGTEKTYKDNSKIDYAFSVYTDQASRPWVQMKKEDSGAYIEIEAPGNISQVDLTITAANNSSGGITDISKHDKLSAGTALNLNTEKTNGTSKRVAYVTGDGSNTSRSIVVSSPANTKLYLQPTGGACRIWGIKVYYSTPDTYSNYITGCCSDPELAYSPATETKTFGDAAFTKTLTNTHNVAVTYALSSVSPAGCVTINSTTGQVSIEGAGSATVTASSIAQEVAGVSYCADEASYTLTVNKANITPTLSYESGTLVIGDDSSNPTIGGNTGSGTVTYAVTTANPAGCVTVDEDGVVTAVAEGTATITATVAATTNYNSATATANFTVNCSAPSSVDISGAFQFYPGETIELTATPTGGAGTPVTYQWKKNGVNIVGATSATYTKNNATAADAGAYTCTVQYGSNCATTSSAFQLKCMQFLLKTSAGDDISSHALTKVDATHATLSLNLTGGTTYNFRITDGCNDWFGNSDPTGITSGNPSNWTMPHDADAKVTTGTKTATYTFNFDFTAGVLGDQMKVSVVYPSTNQASGKVIYWDNEVNKWDGSKLWYRIGKSDNNLHTQLSKVAGTANFYSVTTSEYNGFDYWHIANNEGQGTGNVYWTKDNSSSGLEITHAMGFEGAPVTEAATTVTPTTTHTTGTTSDNDNCEFYTYSITTGMKTYTVTLSGTNCTVAMEKYNDDAGTSTTALASGETVMPTQYIRVTVTPITGYQFSSLVVTNGTTVTAAAAGTPGVYYITGNATVTATCTVKTCTVNFEKNSGSGGDGSTTATYGSAMTTVTAPTRTGYTFDGYWDAETDNNGSGTQYYLANGTSARNWDKDVTATQTLYAKWNAKQYTIELDREGAASGATSVTATFDAGTLAGWSAPSKTGYEFGGYWSGDNGVGTLVISTSGVLQNSVTIETVDWIDGSGHWVKDGGVTVYAKWTAEQYTITYLDQGGVAYSGSNSALLPAKHTYGAATDLVDGVRSGYRFDGWYDNSSCTGSAITSIGATAKEADFTLYAKWTAVYTVTWHVGNGTWDVGEHDVTVGNTQVVSGGKIDDMPEEPADNTLSSCANTFMGWSTHSWGVTPKGTGTGEYDDLFFDVTHSPTISGTTHFYAVFAKSETGSWTLDYSKETALSSSTAWGSYGTAYNYTASDGGTWTVKANKNSGMQINYGKDCSIKIPDCSGDITSIVVTGSQNKAVQFSKSDYDGSTMPTIEVTGSDAYTQTLDFTGKSITAGYIVPKTNANPITKIVVNYGSISDYVTQCDPNQVNVTYDANDGTTTCAGGAHDKRNDYTICATEPTRDYYTFAGWLCSADDATYDAGATIEAEDIDDDFTLTAQWAPVVYNITYSLHGGTTAGGNPTTYNVTTATIDLADGTYGHNRFEGWYSTYNEGTGAYSDQVTSIPVGSHGDITLHAKWTERHEIIFDADGTMTTIYRADDEALDASVDGQGSVPSDPSAPTTCSSKVFVGWSESEIDDETNTRPSDLMKPAEGKVDEDKHYYAVWALRAGSPAPATYAGTGTFVKITSMSDVETDTYYVLRGIKSTTVKVMNNTVSSGRMGTADDPVSENVITNPSAAIVWKLGGKKDAYTLYNQDASKYVEITSDGTSGFALNASPTSGYAYTITVENGHGFFIKSNANNRGITLYGVSEFRSYLLSSAQTLELYKLPAYTYSAYSTSCCETKVNLTHNSPEHGTIEFGKERVGTCGEDKEVSLTIIPDAGYKLTGWTVNTASGYADAKTTDPAVVTTNNNSAAQNITLTFAEGAEDNYDVTATFGLMTVESWTWTHNSAAISDPFNLYVGQTARFDVAYTPAGVDASKKTYTRTKVDAYINWSGVQSSTYSTISGKASTGENTTPVTFTHADGPTTTVNVKVLPLPAVHFGDIVHNVAFDDVVATLSDNTLSPTKTTPTHADFDGSNANSCEEQHLHLVGWIRSDWPALEAYLNSTGAKPTMTEITTAGNDGEGHAYFFTPGEDINTQTFNGVTFYAVWAKVE